MPQYPSGFEPDPEGFTPDEGPSIISKIWGAISEPLTDIPSRAASAIAKTIDKPSLTRSPFEAGMSGFKAGAFQGIGDIVSGLTSPINLATAILTGGTSLAAKAGLSSIARALNIGTKAAGGMMGLHGAGEVLSPESTLGKRGFGLAEMAGGLAGLKSKVPSIGKRITSEVLPRDVVTGDIPVGREIIPGPLEAPAPMKGPQFNLRGRTGTTGLAQLPSELRGAKPRFNIGQNSYIPKFESDIDKALYIVAQETPSARNADYLEFIRDNTGLDSNAAEKLGRIIRKQIKDLVKGQYPGEVNIPSLWKPSEAQKLVSGPRPQVFVLKSRTATPENVKMIKESGYEIDGLTDNGEFRFKYTGKVKPQPILESEIPLMSPRQVKKIEKVSKSREAYELSRALMSVDLPFTTSAAFRQALPMIGTKNWFKAWYTATKAYGSETFYQATMKKINDSPLFRERPKVGGGITKSFADEIGIRMTDLGTLSGREEMLRSTIAEKIPVYGKLVRASNRAYTAFLNDLRANTLEQLVKDSKVMGMDVTRNLPVARQIAEFINDATGRGSLKISIGTKKINLERSARLLTDTFFSPRLIASRIRMLNPSTYIMSNPFVRRQYTHAMLRTIGAWWGIASLAEMAGAYVSKDPTSADFGKIRIRNTRIDPAGGFQQYLVLGSRIKPEIATIGSPTETGITPVDLLTGLIGTPGGAYTSSTSGIRYPFGEGYKPETRWSTGLEFMTSKLHPVLKFAIDMARAHEKREFHLGDRTIQMFLPIITGDIMQILKEDPSLLPLVIPAGTTGMGTQTYEKGITEPSFLPEEYDIILGRK